jgi:hypothetical protein
VTHQEATKILDMAKDGQPIPEDVLTEALFMTGDAACWLDIPCPDVAAFVQDMREAGLL